MLKSSAEVQACRSAGLPSGGAALQGCGTRAPNVSTSLGGTGHNRHFVDQQWIFETASLEECIAWVKKSPNPHPDEAETDIEIRQIFAPEDFGDIAPEVIEQERRLMAEAAARHKK